MLWMSALAMAAPASPTPYLVEWVAPVYPNRPVLCLAWVAVASNGSAEITLLGEDSTQRTQHLAQRTAKEIFDRYQAGTLKGTPWQEVWDRYEAELAVCKDLRESLDAAVVQWRFTQGFNVELPVRFHHDPRNPVRVLRRVQEWPGDDRAEGQRCLAGVAVDGEGTVTEVEVHGCSASAAAAFEGAIGQWTFVARGAPWKAMYAGRMPATIAPRNDNRATEWFPGDGFDDGTCWVVARVSASGKAELVEEAGCRDPDLAQAVAKWRFAPAEREWVLVNATAP